MKKFMIFIFLVSSVFAVKPEIIVKVPVQLDKLPSDVKIDGIDVRNSLTCTAKSTKRDGFMG
ncbi:MAG TPA: hypothetical protein EYG93_04060 [Sulfurospirillum arcachonense]|nr:hypothetical protein [Sulfurospirillum arcachonense]